MFPTSSDRSIGIVPVAIGGIAILLALWNKPLLRWIRLKPLSEVFTTPRFRRSARITQWLGRLFLAIFGIGFLVQGIGARYLPDDLTSAVSLAVLGLAGLILLAMVGVILAHRKA